MQQLETLLYDPEDVELSTQVNASLDVYQRAERAVTTIAGILKANHRLVIAASMGKDSSALVNLVLTAARSVRDETGNCPPIVITHGDTLIESPVARSLADNELHKIEVYAKKNGLDVTVHIAKPALAASFAGSIISGRALPSFPNRGRECAINWKINPMQTLYRKMAKQQGHDPSAKAHVTMTGVRSNESAARKLKTQIRKESSSEIWTNDAGALFLSPILEWETDDVFEYLGYCAAGLIPSYSNFEQVMEFYADAGGSSCSVVGDITVQRNSKPCGARSGCFLCTSSTDKSARTMIENAPEKYSYLVPLLRLRDFIEATENDWSRRNFIARTIDESGFIKIAADQYSPAMCEELLRYSLYAQDEANRLGSPSRVSILGIREVVAVDFFWSVRSMHPPFHALKIYLEHMDGNVQQAPVIKKPKGYSPVPQLGRIFVGKDWDEDICEAMGATGLRDPIWEIFVDSCGPTLKTNRGGKILLDLDGPGEFDVDEEGANDLLGFEGEHLIELYHRQEADWTAAASVYLRYGTVTLGKGMSISVDKAIRRSQWRQRHELHGQRSPDELWRRCTERVAQQEALFSIA